MMRHLCIIGVCFAATVFWGVGLSVLLRMSGSARCSCIRLPRILYEGFGIYGQAG
jgi:hypothetical protein